MPNPGTLKAAQWRELQQRASPPSRTPRWPRWQTASRTPRTTAGRGRVDGALSKSATSGCCSFDIKPHHDNTADLLQLRLFKRPGIHEAAGRGVSYTQPPQGQARAWLSLNTRLHSRGTLLARRRGATRTHPAPRGFSGWAGRPDYAYYRHTNFETRKDRFPPEDPRRAACTRSNGLAAAAAAQAVQWGRDARAGQSSAPANGGRGSARRGGIHARRGGPGSAVRDRMATQAAGVQPQGAPRGRGAGTIAAASQAALSAGEA